MAIKSPGVYLGVNDNTVYTNATETSGTTVAIVGYATKGPIGEPTYLSSWKNYVKTFGEATSVGYSSLAAKRIFSAGGTVLFTRVADTSTATQSTCTIKNGVTAFDGYTSFVKATDIKVGSSGYSVGNIYTAKVTNTDVSAASKTLYVRAPATGKLTQASILNQISTQLGATAGSYEVVCGESTSVNGGFYSFGVKIDGTDIYGTSFADYPLFTTVTDDETPEAITADIVKAINTGSNAICRVNVIKGVTDISTAVTSTSTFVKEDATLGSDTKRYFTIVVDNKTSVVSVDISAGMTYATLVQNLNSVLYSTYGVKVYFIDGTSSKNAQIVFVRTLRGPSYSVDVDGVSNGTDESATASVTELFASSTSKTAGGTVSAVSGINYYNSTLTYTGTVFVPSKAITASATASVTEGTDWECTYTSGTTGSILFTTGTKTGAGKSISIYANTEGLGTFLFSRTSGIGTVAQAVEGQDALSNVTVSLVNKAIRFTSNAIAYPKVEAVDTSSFEDPTIYGSLITIEGGVTSVTGQNTVDASTKDQITFISKEYGSNTDSISVEVYTSTSPLDSSKKHTIYIYDDGTLKETYEDVSYTYANGTADFAEKINETAENGGSSYVSVSVVKNDTASLDVELPDGTYYVGADSSNTNVTYTVGTDGIPDDGDELFETVLATDGILSNVDLYSYQILITPDDISQEVQDAAIALCDSTELSTYIADSPNGYTRADVVNWHNGKNSDRDTALSSKFAEVYSPWMKIYDSDAESYKWVMPSVIMAAKFVSVDNTYGCWYAPAGETNGTLSVTSLYEQYNHDDRDAMYLNYNRVNPIIQYSDGTILAYGEKTCQRTNSTLTKIHTVRMVIDIKRRLRSSLKGFIFLPNLGGNLSKISATVSSIMERYKTGGGVSSYTVVCDSSNNTAETMQQDIVNVAVACVPVGCIEEVDITLNLNKTDSTITVS